jgi:two-component system, chemotaxis family, chemotaxis protein CheY
MSETLFGRMRVLVVEDESYTRRVIRGMLRQSGVREIVEAEDGGKGFIELLQFHPHLVFCDIHMQPVDGIEFLRIVRGADTKSVAATRVIFLTADAQRDTVMSAKDLSVDGYLVKPVSLHRLQAKLHETRILMPELQ